DPSDTRTADVAAEIGRQIKAMPPHRIFTPDTEVLGRAALLSGILCRLQGVCQGWQAARAPGLRAVPAGAEAGPRGADGECPRLRCPAPAHPGRAGAVLPPDMSALGGLAQVVNQ